ncbi:MAG: tRNA preQ1(34) S-adenosylmethionine ribosyltransferase-isomerase QueA [Vallitaleaceae bacterium]|nr:tRNA preQ1(34) S-adenosylmethionine ribosyltransferase-isomerase QueA [Vallitaleaceae bacterium]
MNVKDFYYDLPEELIAQVPLQDRSASKLLIMHREKEELEHRSFADILEYLQEGDCLVLNNTRVLPARLIGEKLGSGGKVEILLLVRKTKEQWEVLVKPGKKAKVGAEIVFGEGLLRGKILEVCAGGNRIIEFSYEGIFEEVLDQLGQMPLPPYITATLEDKERYQTVYSKHLGSAAAPTAGLHFTKDLLEKIEKKKVHIAYVTLHVGLGTFRPVKVENIVDHEMHSEYCTVTDEDAKIINATKERGARIIAVGTTSLRTLESLSNEEGRITANSMWTDIFIYPGYRFKMIDGLITNFHLPESTLIMLVSALAGRDFVMKAYQEAINKEYRFFSFGDAMLIL